MHRTHPSTPMISYVQNLRSPWVLLFQAASERPNACTCQHQRSFFTSSLTGVLIFPSGFAFLMA